MAKPGTTAGGRFDLLRALIARMRRPSERQAAMQPPTMKQGGVS